MIAGVMGVLARVVVCASLVLVTACSGPSFLQSPTAPREATNSPPAETPARASGSIPGSSATPGIVIPDGEFDTTLGRDALPFVGHMFIFQDATLGPDAAAPGSAVIELDQDASVTALVPQAGGTVTATGSDGSVYTLDISRTALLTDVDITMTPISSVSTVDQRGFDAKWESVFGVQLEPEGLHLSDAASLRIEPPGADTAGWVAVATGFGGSDLHRYPLLPDAAVATLPITHFSNFFVADPATQNLPDSIPSNLQAQLEVDLAEGLEGGLTDAEASDLGEKYWPVIFAILDRALTDCAFAEGGAVARVKSMIGMMAAAGLPIVEDNFEPARERVLAAIVNCIRELIEQPCFDEDYPAHARRLMALVRQLEQMDALEGVAPILRDLFRDREPKNCGAIHGTIVWSQQARSGQIRETETMILNINMTALPLSTDRGSSYIWTVSGSGPCLSYSLFGAGALYYEESTSGTGGVVPPYPKFEILGGGEEIRLVAPVRGEEVVSSCPGVSTEDDVSLPGCPVVDGGLVGRIKGDTIDFACTDDIGETTVSGILTISP